MANLQVGDKDVKDVKVGDKQVKEVWVGDKLVWQNQVIPGIATITLGKRKKSSSQYYIDVNWAASSNTDSYTIYGNVDGPPSSTIKTGTGGAGGTVTVTVNRPPNGVGARYLAKSTTVSPTGDTATSPTVETDIPSVLPIILPPPTITISQVGNQLNISWSSMSGASSYKALYNYKEPVLDCLDLQWQSQQTFTSVGNAQQIPAFQYKCNDGKIQIKIASINADGEIGGYSGYKEVTIQRGGMLEHPNCGGC